MKEIILNTISGIILVIVGLALLGLVVIILMDKTCLTILITGTILFLSLMIFLWAYYRIINFLDERRFRER